MSPCRVVCSVLLVSVSMILAACGSSHPAPPAPTFTSTPGTTATQGSPYSYSLAATDPSGGTVSFALTTAPTGATLTGNTLNWTPPVRSSSNFTVTATTSEGGSAAQSWTVQASGTVTINWVNTYWEASGQVQEPANSAAALGISAVLPQSDGSFSVIKATTSSPGVFNIPNVPGGNYWLAFGGLNLLPDSTSAYWTNATTFDAGRDLAGSPVAIITGTSTTTFDLNLSGLDSVSVETPVVFDPQNSSPLLPLPIAPNTSTVSLGLNIFGNIDWSQVNSLVLGQYEPVTLGPWSNAVLGPSVLLSNPAFAEGGINSITQTLQKTPTSLDVSISGSQWSTILNATGPAAPTSFAGAMSLVAEPYVTGRNAQSGIAVSNIVLSATAPTNSQIFGFDPFAPSCDPPGFLLTPLATTPAVLSDQDLGMLSYSDPFDSSWTRAETLCQEAVIPVPIPNSSATADFALVDSATVAPSSSSLAPVVGPVQNPTIGGGSLFTAATLSTTTPSLSWTAPAIGTPYGYRVTAYVQEMVANFQSYAPAGSFYTSQTSITLPPLSAGNTYVFAIVALADAAANIQTSPFRSALPTGFAHALSAPITISSGAASPQIHGDSSVVRRFSQSIHSSPASAVQEKWAIRER